MRKLISIIAALALVGSVAAQKGKKAAAKAPAKAPAVAAPKVPAVPVAAPAAAKSEGGSKFIINAWGGYSINAKTDLYKAAEAFGDATTSASNFSSKSTDAKNTGVAGGVDFWYGDKFQFGVGAYYLQGFKTTKTLTFSGATGGTVTSTTQMNYIPVLLQVRFFLFEGLYAGAGVGVAIVNGGKTEATLSGGLVGQVAGYPYSATYTGTKLWAEGRLGYRLGLGDMVGLDVFGIFSYQTGEASWITTDSQGQLTTATNVTNNGLNITPGLALSLKF